MVIDGHAHICGDFYNAEDIIAIVDEHAVDKVVLCPGPVRSRLNLYPPRLKFYLKWRGFVFWFNKLIRFATWLSCSSRKLIRGNKLVHQFCQQYPSRLIQFYWVNPLDPASVEDLIQKHPLWNFKGIKLHQPGERFKMDDPAVKNVLLYARENMLPVFVHLYSKNEVKKFIQLARDFPKTNFIVAHMIGVEYMIEYASILNNVYFDVSPFWLNSADWIEKTIQAFGVNRLVFGSDSPYGKKCLFNNLEKIRSLDLGGQQKEMILAKNLEALLP